MPIKEHHSTVCPSRSTGGVEYFDAGVGIGMLVAPSEGWVGGWVRGIPLIELKNAKHAVFVGRY